MMDDKEFLREWNKLRDIREMPKWADKIPFMVKKHEQHYQQYTRLEKLARMYPDALYDLIFSGAVTDEMELYDLIRLGSGNASTAKKDNLHWVDFQARVRERQEELPQRIQDWLDLYLEIFGW